MVRSGNFFLGDERGVCVNVVVVDGLRYCVCVHTHTCAHFQILDTLCVGMHTKSLFEVLK